jgi:hypothetical protein
MGSLPAGFVSASRAIVSPVSVPRAIVVAALGAVVGTVPFFINQLGVVMAGHITGLVAARTLLTYLVPFSISTCSALQINKLARNARMAWRHLPAHMGGRRA